MTNTSLLIKRSIKSAASLAGGSLAYKRASRGVVNIIAYHRVVADIAKAESDAIYGIVISTDSFRRHCEMLRRYYDVVSLETARHFLDTRTRTARPMAVLTFDDGYLDFYHEAFPVLNELGLPATVFLPTDCIGSGKPLAHDRIYWLLKLAMTKSIPIGGALQRAGVGDAFEQKLNKSADLLKLTDAMVYLPHSKREELISELEREIGVHFEPYPGGYDLLDWDMVREMANAGINFGGHTANHVVLPLESLDDAEAEITNSRLELESQLSRKVYSFAYPNGEYNADIQRLVEKAGYEVAVTTETRLNGAGSDPLSLGRYSFCEESTRGITGMFSPKVAALRLGV
jgi:peptidoglycan/xylan/chitin deacetylase (PgdA/CDA1 family)